MENLDRKGHEWSMNETLLGLLLAFGRQYLDPAQRDVIGKYFPELLPIFGIDTIPTELYGIPIGLYKRLMQLRDRGDWIQAIKELRGELNWTLKESKDWMENYLPKN